MSQIRVGISGWRYAPWRGTFYPKGLAQKRELEYASQHLSTIEINGSFYALQTPKSYQAWHDATPEDFVFSVKGGRFITHTRRLKDVADPLANFFASGLLKLGAKLGPILWQLPPSFRYDAERIAHFLELLPHDTQAAAKLARRHDEHLKGETWTKTDAQRELRHAMEVRHDSFQQKEFVQLLRKHGVALVVADTAGRYPYFEDQTADFTYARLHGDEELYASGYTDKALQNWTKKFRTWCQGKSKRDAFVYFDNDVKVHAPYDAMSLAYRLKVGPKPEARDPAQK